MLIYGDRIGAVVRAVVPPGDGTPEDDFPTRIQASLFGYVRGQVLFSLIMGTSAGLMLWVLGSLGIFPDGKTYAIAFGAWLRVRGADPVRRAGDRRASRRWCIAALSDAPARRRLADHRLHRPAAARGPRRRAERVRPGAAHQPAAGDLRAAAGRPAGRLHRRVHRAADRGDPARDGRLPAPPLASSAGTCRPSGHRRARHRPQSAVRSAARSSRRGATSARRAGRSSATPDEGASARRPAPGTRLWRAMAFPATRLRRLRQTGVLRGLVRETELVGRATSSTRCSWSPRPERRHADRRRCRASTTSRSTARSRRRAIAARARHPGRAAVRPAGAARTSEGSGAWDDEGVDPARHARDQGRPPRPAGDHRPVPVRVHEPRPLRRAARRRRRRQRRRRSSCSPAPRSRRPRPAPTPSRRAT